MSKLTDETLMLYADGLLASPDREDVEKVLSEDKELRSRLQIFRLTGPDLADLLQDHVNAPVPDRLRDSLLKRQLEPFSLAHIYRLFSQIPEFVLEKLRINEVWSLQSSMAVVMAIIAGVGLGWLLRGGGAANLDDWANLIRIEANQLVAQGSLEETLESVSSGEVSNVSLADSQQIDMGIKMTFQNDVGEYCRQYEMTVPTSKSYTGVACRSGGDWIVKIQAMTAPSRPNTDRFVPANGGDRLALDAAIGALVFSAPMTGEEEAAILTNGWKQ